MTVTAIFSQGLGSLLAAKAIGDEFDLTVRARIIGAEEVLIDVTPIGAADKHVERGELEVKLLLSRAEEADGA